MTSEKIISFALFFPGFLLSLSVHEAAHAWVANLFGDPTAKRLGRVSLNPMSHIDWIGTVLLPAFGFFVGGLIIGWGKPVPVDYRNLRNFKKDGFFIASAGPLSNLILALFFAVIIHLILYLYPEWQFPNVAYQGYMILSAFIQVFILNLALAFFNMIPIHPLDGGKVMYGILPQPLAGKFDDFISKYGVMILLFLFISGAFKIIVGYPIKIVAGLLL